MIFLESAGVSNLLTSNYLRPGVPARGIVGLQAKTPAAALYCLTASVPVLVLALLHQHLVSASLKCLLYVLFSWHSQFYHDHLSGGI